MKTRRTGAINAGTTLTSADTAMAHGSTRQSALRGEMDVGSTSGERIS